MSEYVYGEPCPECGRTYYCAKECETDPRRLDSAPPADDRFHTVEELEAEERRRRRDDDISYRRRNGLPRRPSL